MLAIIGTLCISIEFKINIRIKTLNLIINKISEPFLVPIKIELNSKE